MIAEFIGTVNLFGGAIEVDEVDHLIIKPNELAQSFYVGCGCRPT